MPCPSPSRGFVGVRTIYLGWFLIVPSDESRGRCWAKGMCVPAQVWELLSGKHWLCSSTQCVFLMLLLYMGHWTRSQGNSFVGERLLPVLVVIVEKATEILTSRREAGSRELSRTSRTISNSHPQPHCCLDFSLSHFLIVTFAL